MIRRLSCSVLLVAGILSASGELSNRRAPSFALPSCDYAKTYDFLDYRGKVLIIDIMTTTCPHCELLTTTLEKVVQKYGNKVAVLSVVLPPDNVNTVSKYISVNHVSIPIACDMGQMTISYLQAKPGQSHVELPHLFIIDKQGMIRNDFLYSEKDKAVFEGPALFPEIDKLLK
ncbi:MAG TPA: TlpA disulfide reductase family protein [Bryobacteraceae bacterium]|nr:TlpA disulfide reductase family protein [Bryobacteraceae bacterium]